MYLVYNSDIIPQENLALTAGNRAFLYGDGLFETMRYEQGRIWFLPDHVDRLSRGLQALKLQTQADFATQVLSQHIHTLLNLNGLIDQPARIKLQVWRQPGGLYSPATNESAYLLTVVPGRPFTVTERKQLGLYTAFRLSSSPISAFKTLNALPYVLAGLYKQEHQMDDVMLLDMGGHLAECNASSLFWLQGHTLYTPSLTTGCIDGIVRRQVIYRANSYGFLVKEGLFTADILMEADLVFCCNAAGIQWFREIQAGELTIPIHRSEQALAALAPLFATLMP